MTSFDESSPTDGRSALQEFAALVQRGHFKRLAAVDRHTGDLLDGHAMALFAQLPAVVPNTSPEELVNWGLLPAAPRLWTHAINAPRYRVGRELFVQTHVAERPRRAFAPVGAYDADGALQFTHRAQLQAQDDVSFWVSLEGAWELLPFAKSAVYDWNEARGIPSGGGSLSGVRVDFHDPAWKAQVCAAFLTLGAEIAALDLQASGAAQAQAALLTRLASRHRMRYAGQGDGYAGDKAAALFVGGQGVCFVQRTVVGAFLQCFARALGFGVQMAAGRTLRRGLPHGFVIVTLRPSLLRFVVDPAWGEPCTRLDVAFFDGRWGHDRRLEALEGERDATVTSSDVELPKVTK